MDNLFRFTSPLSPYAAPLLYFQNPPNPNPKNQKIAIIVSIALLALSILYLMVVCCCCCKRRRINVNQGGNHANLPRAVHVPLHRGNPKANLQQPRKRNKPFKQPQVLPSKEIQEKLDNLLDIERKIIDLGSKLKVEQETLELSAQPQNFLPMAEEGFEVEQILQKEEQIADQNKGIEELAEKLADEVNEHPVDDQKKIENIVKDQDIPLIFDGMTVNELAIMELNGELEKPLKEYPAIFRVYLEAKFKQTHTNQREIHERIAIFSGLMNTHKDNQIFIHESLKQIDLFLTNTFFPSNKKLCLQEQQKIDLIVFHLFFSLVDEHFLIIQQLDPQLAFNLKVKLANLPLIDEIDRTKYSNVYLSDKDQLEILIKHFQKKEDENLDFLLQNFQVHTEQDIKRISKSVNRNKSHLSENNLFKLRDALDKMLGEKAPLNWNNEREGFESLKQYFIPHFRHHQHRDQGGTACLGLQLANKAKRFFQDQVGADAILIPRWYHATHLNNLWGILNVGEIEVRHRKAYKGAWVSNQRERGYGDHVLVFNQCLTQIDTQVFIGFEKGKVRWRGLQKSIPFIALEGGQYQGIRYLAFVGMPDTAQKVNKTRIIQSLQQKGIAHPQVFSNRQIDYIHKEILRCIGSPNLPEKWWGKANVEVLEKMHEAEDLFPRDLEKF